MISMLKLSLISLEELLFLDKNHNLESNRSPHSFPSQWPIFPSQ